MQKPLFMETVMFGCTHVCVTKGMFKEERCNVKLR